MIAGKLLQKFRSSLKKHFNATKDVERGKEENKNLCQLEGRKMVFVITVKRPRTLKRTRGSRLSSPSSSSKPSSSQSSSSSSILSTLFFFSPTLRSECGVVEVVRDALSGILTAANLTRVLTDPTQPFNWMIKSIRGAFSRVAFLPHEMTSRRERNENQNNRKSDSSMREKIAKHIRFVMANQQQG
jgi:hypothetical protein